MKKVSLAEVMGTQGSQGNLKLSSLRDLLGEAMPDMPRNSVGRHRLVRSLQQRFGSNFRSLPGISGLVKEFDAEIEFEKKLAKIRAIKPGSK